MYGGSGASPSGSPSSRTRQRPSPRCSSSSTGAVPAPCLEPSRRAREREPLTVALVLEQEHLALRLLDPDPRRHDSRVVDDRKLTRELVRQLGEPPVPDRAGRAVVDEEAGGVAALGRMLGDQLRGQVVVELGGVHPTASVASCAWTRGHSNGRKHGSRKPRPGGSRRPSWKPRSSARASRSSRSPRPPPSSRARCPRRSAPPCTTASAPKSLPVGRSLAEIRGLLNQVIRRLERLEGDVLAERHARIDDLALLVDLVSSGWRGVSDRLERVEHAVAPAARAPRQQPRAR